MARTEQNASHTKIYKEYKRMSNVELIQRVIAVLMYGNWTQGSNAVNALGLPCSPLSDDACKWCMRGAAIHVLQPSHSVLVVDLHNPISEISKQIAHALGFKTSEGLIQWNDNQDRTEQDVIDYLKFVLISEEVKERGRRAEKDMGQDDQRGEERGTGDTEE